MPLYNHYNGTDLNISNYSSGKHSEEPLPFETGKYVGVLVTLDIMSFFLIIFLGLSAAKAYKFMANKDRILLSHFIFLEFSLFCKNFQFTMVLIGKTLSLLFGALYYQE
jgi:hypothetical protein